MLQYGEFSVFYSPGNSLIARRGAGLIDKSSASSRRGEKPCWDRLAAANALKLQRIVIGRGAPQYGRNA
jgi:hypothetical protein